MKDFIKFTLATITGIVFLSVVGFILGIATLVGIAVSSEKEVLIKPYTILTLKLDKEITERGSKDPFAMIMGEEYENIGLDEIIDGIEKAKTNDNIMGIYIEGGNANGIPTAYLEEIRRALLDFKKSGKFIIAYGDNYLQSEYYLASVADKVFLNPSGLIAWQGLSAQPIFFKDALDKLGIEMQIFKVGTYKSAVEPYIATKMSEANREQVTAYLGSIWDKIVNDIAEERHLSPEALNQMANEGIIFHEAKEYLKLGLVDSLLYLDGVKDYLESTSPAKYINTIDLKEMVNVSNDNAQTLSNDVVAVYYAEGEIVDEAEGLSTSNPLIIGSQVITDLSKLRNDNNVKAVVLRVSSPGGSAFASEQIWHELIKLKAIKPVIVSMGSMAASGGYYISCMADSIFAEATTLTGSIGIFGMFPNIKELVNDKLGIHFDVVKTNKFADFGNLTRELSADEKLILQQYVERGYKLFLKRCAKGRNMSEEEIHNIAEGRVWTGEMALGIGLIDKIGGLNEAIEAAAQKAGLEEYTILKYPQQDNLFTQLMNEGKENYINSRIKAAVGEYYGYFNFINNLNQMNPVQARIEFNPNIKW